MFLAEIFMMDNKITRAQEIESLVVEGVWMIILWTVMMSNLKMSVSITMI